MYYTLFLPIRIYYVHNISQDENVYIILDIRLTFKRNHQY